MADNEAFMELIQSLYQEELEGIIKEVPMGCTPYQNTYSQDITEQCERELEAIQLENNKPFDFQLQEEDLMLENKSNFKLVIYYDKETDELVHIEDYKDGLNFNFNKDIDSYSYGYRAEVIKPEQLIQQNKIYRDALEKIVDMDWEVFECTGMFCDSRTKHEAKQALERGKNNAR